jgi:hypothetical protein
MNLHFYLKSYFHYKRSERAGLKVLMLIVLISFAFPYLVKSYCGVNNQLPVSSDFYCKFDSLRNLQKVRKNYKRPTSKFTDKIIDLNKADTNLLKQVRGLASYYAHKIVRYRERLGGYYSVEQLKDLKLHKGTYEKIYKQFIVDSTFVKKFDFDTISFKNLLRHPYFDYQTVKKIFKIKYEYRGISPEFLLEKQVIDTSLYFKIRPYCVVK